MRASVQVSHETRSSRARFDHSAFFLDEASESRSDFGDRGEPQSDQTAAAWFVDSVASVASLRREDTWSILMLSSSTKRLNPMPK